MPTKMKAGRPTYVATEKDRNIVRMLTGFGIDQVKICEALDISGPTLRKHFKKEIRIGAAQVETQLIGNMLRLADGKDGTAYRANEFLLNCRFGWSRYAPPQVPKDPVQGKKEQRLNAAETGHEQTGWGDLIH